MPFTYPPPVLALSPLAVYLKANLAAMKAHPEYRTIPAQVVAVGEESPDEGIVYLLDASQQILGYIEAHQKKGVVVAGQYVFVPEDRTGEDEAFRLDLTQPVAVRSVAVRFQPPMALSGPSLVAPAPVEPPPRASARGVRNRGQ